MTGTKARTQNAAMTFSQAVKALEEAGFNQEQARAVAEAVSESVSTKADLLALELRVGEKFDAKLDTLEKRLDAKIDALDKKVDAKIDALDKKFDAKIDRLDTKIDTLDKKFDAKFDALNNRLLVGTLSIVAALVASIAGAVFTLVQLLQ